MGPDTTYVHGYFFDDDDLRKVADTGGSIAFAPEIATLLGVGRPPVTRVRRAGILPSISTDEVVTGSGSILAANRALLHAERSRSSMEALSRGVTPYEVSLTAQEALEFSILGGVAACGRRDDLGVVAAGKKADLIVIRLDAMKYQPVNDPINQFVLSGDSGDVDTVIIDGVIRKRAGRLTHPGLAGVLAEATRQRDALFDRLERKAGESWLPRNLSLDTGWL